MPDTTQAASDALRCPDAGLREEHWEDLADRAASDVGGDWSISVGSALMMMIGERAATAMGTMRAIG